MNCFEKGMTFKPGDGLSKVRSMPAPVFQYRIFSFA